MYTINTLYANQMGWNNEIIVYKISHETVRASKTAVVLCYNLQPKKEKFLA